MPDFRILFRADASQTIGSGHVMRCLSLADQLAAEGGRSHFLCTEHEGEMSQQIRRRGHNCSLIPASNTHLCEEDDAALCLQRAGNVQSECYDWVVVDHYELSDRWHRLMRSCCRAVMVIDDLANRKYDCDLLLDQNWNRQVADYAGLINPDTELLAGTNYALLRPEFAATRQELDNNRSNLRRVESIMISVGGADPGNKTITALNALSQLPCRNRLKVDIVLGAQYRPGSDAQLRHDYCASFRQINVHRQSEHMAQLMKSADIAIGAVGTTTWERCCVGLPTLATIYAENQRRSAEALAREGVIALWQDQDELVDKLHQLTENAELYNSMIVKSLGVCDGKGAGRVVKHLMSRLSQLGAWPG